MDWAQETRGEVRTASCMGGISAGACAAQCIHKRFVKTGEKRGYKLIAVCGHKDEGHLWKTAEDT